QAYAMALRFDPNNKMARTNLGVVYGKAQAMKDLKILPPAGPGLPPRYVILDAHPEPAVQPLPAPKPLPPPGLTAE
ncbi:MAG: hypothetical protein KGL53_15195, partial [Elusimicrobia bacterium]|nr:hypothetical protein [Elusimicrobiota bacterium]